MPGDKIMTMAKKAGKPVREALAACPFCGYDRPRLDKYRNGDDGPMVYIVECPGCDASGPVMGGNTDRARAAWNRRGETPETYSLEARGADANDEEPDDDASTEEPAVEHEGAEPIESPTPCPWCSSRTVYVQEQEVAHGKRRENFYYAFCGNCEACGPAHDTTAGFAVLSWNARFP